MNIYTDSFVLLAVFVFLSPSFCCVVTKLNTVGSFWSSGQILCGYVVTCIRHWSNHMLTIESIVIPVRSGCNCALLSDQNLTPHFQKWQHSNCLEKSWLSERYQNTTTVPSKTTQHHVYLQWSAATNAFHSFNHEAYLPHQCQTSVQFVYHGSAWTVILCSDFIIKHIPMKCCLIHINTILDL